MDISVTYPNFHRKKILTRWAGIIGVLQSLIWIGLSIVGIVHYNNCIVDYQNDDNKISFGTIMEIVFYKLYFYGKDVNNLPPNIDDISILNDDDIQTTLNTEQIYIWVWVYLVSSIFWLLSSISLIIKMNKTNLRQINTLLFIWIFITLLTSGMDLSLSVIFGLDYDKFNTKLYNLPLEKDSKGLNGIILLSAKISSFIMLIMAAKGFILWFINVGFMSYFLKETIVISETIAGDSPYINRDFMSDTHSIANRSPINAYDTKNNVILSNGQNGQSGQNGQNGQSGKNEQNQSIKLNTDAIERASRMSNAVLNQRNNSGGQYNRSFSSFAQYPNNNERNNHYDPRYPEPDYTPPMPRSNPFLITPLRPIPSQSSSSLKNKRYS